MSSGAFLTNLHASFTKYVDEVGVTNLFLLLLLAVITFYPLSSIGFTTHDDASLAISVWNGDAWATTKGQSVSQGRFGFFWTIPLSTVPYFFDSHIWSLTTKFVSFFLLLSALYYAVFKSFRSGWIALTTLAFFLSIIQNGWEHNALTSYPVVFNILATFFLVSLSLFATAIDRKSLALAWLSGVLYFFALGVELFVLFFPFYIAVLLSRLAPNESVIGQIKSGKKYIFAIALPLIVYLATYLVWRHIHPSIYDGNSFSRFNLLATAKVVSTYSLTAFPLASLHIFSSPSDPLPFTNATSLPVIISGLNTMQLIKPVAAGFLFYRLMTSVRFIVPQPRTLKIGAILAFVGIFLPNLLLGFVQRHQIWVADGTHSYVYTYYSFISAVVYAALFLAYINAKSRLWNPKLRQTLILVVVVLVMVLSFAVEVRNQYFVFDQKLAHRKWQLMDVVIKSPAFMEISNGSVVVAPTLLSPTRGYAAVLADDWSNYVKYKTGKDIKFVDNKCKSMGACYLLVFRQGVNSDNQFIVLAKITNPATLVSSNITVYSMPNQTGATIIGAFMPGKASPKLEINSKKITNVGIGLFSSSLFLASDHNMVQTARVIGNVSIIPEKITISPYSVEPRLRPLSAELAEGIDFKRQDYPDFLAEVSGMSGNELGGRWTDAAVGPVAKFRFKQALPRKFTLEITATAFGPNFGAPVKVRVGSLEKTFAIISSKKVADTYSLEFETDGTANILEITPPKPTSPNELDPKNRDTRKLGIFFAALKIKG